LGSFFRDQADVSEHLTTFWSKTIQMSHFGFGAGVEIARGVAWTFAIVALEQENEGVQLVSILTKKSVFMIHSLRHHHNA
jgi:hypothetical protein